MKFNHVTLPARDLSTSIGFYQALGFEVIVKDDHCARLKNPSDTSTLSLELRTDGGDGAHVYFECSDLDDRVTAHCRTRPQNSNPAMSNAWVRQRGF